MAPVTTSVALVTTSKALVTTSVALVTRPQVVKDLCNALHGKPPAFLHIGWVSGWSLWELLWSESSSLNLAFGSQCVGWRVVQTASHTSLENSLVKQFT